MDGINVNVNTTINIAEKQSVKVQVNNQVQVENTVKYENDGYAKPDSSMKTGKVPTNISFSEEPVPTPEQKQPDSTLKGVKKISAGVLLGGGIGAAANSIGRAVVTESFTKPTAFGVGVGVSIGAGIALLNMETSDKKVRVAKNVAGAALLGGGAMGVAQSIAKTVMTESVHAGSASGMLLAGTLGGGIALANADVGQSKSANTAKRVGAGVMIGAGTAGIATGIAKTLMTDRLMGASPTVTALGATLGAGIALANSDVDSKGLKLAKNAASGALIAGSAVGIVTSLGKTLASEALSNPSWVSVGVAVAVGAGIGIAATKE
jgi:hypothetical protein